MTVVTGTSDCPSFDFGTVTTDSKGVQHSRGGTFACTETVNDPRVSGASTATWNLDWWGTADHKSGALVQWGTGRLVNAGGAWEGRSTGVYSSDRGDMIATWFKGTGGYAGLAYFTLESGWGPWTIQGQIFPGAPPNPEGVPPVSVATPSPTIAAGPATPSSPSPTAIAHGPVTMVAGTLNCPSIDFGRETTGPDGVQHARGGALTCTETADDPGVSGAHTESWNADWWGTADHTSGALVQWGTVRLVNAGGAWEGRFTGVYSSDRGDMIAVWYKGTGRYAGLAYFTLESGTGPWTIQGQIFPGNPPTM